MPTECILHYRRRRARPEAGGHTLFCNVTRDGGINDVMGYPTPNRFPDFAGEEAWFRVRWFSTRRFEVIEQVADRQGAPLPANP
ncbi:MAG: hypothetical protein EON87_00750 [Brevundimonas sp.]|nr:MAG: hypothetical protein EON87_00750 [Brevundimonas sp.]